MGWGTAHQEAFRFSAYESLIDLKPKQGSGFGALSASSNPELR